MSAFDDIAAGNFDFDNIVNPNIRDDRAGFGAYEGATDDEYSETYGTYIARVAVYPVKGASPEAVLFDMESILQTCSSNRACRANLLGHKGRRARTILDGIQQASEGLKSVSTGMTLMECGH